MSIQRAVGVIVGFLAAAVLVAAAKPDDKYAIRLVSRTFVPLADTTAFRQTNQRYGVIQFLAIPDTALSSKVKAAGFVLHDYLPNFAYAATIPSGIKTDQLAALNVRALFDLEPRDKISPRILLAGSGKVDAVVRTFPDFPIQSGVAALKRAGATVRATAPAMHVIGVQVEQSKIAAIAALNWVRWIEAAAPPPQADNDGSRASIGVDVVQATPFNLSGSGVALGLFDQGFPVHADYYSRLTTNGPGISGWHPTHVAGTMAGDGSQSSNQYRGMAPQASIYAWDIFTTWSLWSAGYIPPMQDCVTNFQCAVSNNSWGFLLNNTPFYCNWFGQYINTHSDELDKLVRNKDLFLAFAAANYRDDGICGITVPNGYNSIPPPQTAKNTVVVGEIQKVTDAMAAESGWGPLADGRLKPDVVAVGQNVTSTVVSPVNGYGAKSGTSVATPAVSGTVALMVERYRQVNGGANPPPDLLKAVLLNTATDLGAAGPDYQNGYGKVNAVEAIKAIDGARFHSDSISQGEVKDWSVQTTAGLGCQLRVMIAYSDKEAGSGAAFALVNDLDLTLISPSGNVHLPLTLNPANPVSLAAPLANHRDNVEQVVVTNPVAGQWTIRVSANSVPFGPQKYALSWQVCDPQSGASTSVQCCSPLNETNFLAMLSEKPLGGTGDDYVNKFQASVTSAANATFNAQMQAYFNYVSLVDTSITTVDIFLFLYDCNDPTGIPGQSVPCPNGALMPSAASRIKVLSWNAYTNSNGGIPVVGDVDTNSGTYTLANPITSTAQVFDDTTQASHINNLYQVVGVVGLDRPSLGAARIEFLDQTCGAFVHQTNHLQFQRLGKTVRLLGKDLPKSAAGRLLRRQLDTVAKVKVDANPKPTRSR